MMQVGRVGPIRLGEVRVRTAAIACAIILFFGSRASAQVHPDKLVFKGDSAVIDSLKRSEYPYVFPIWGEKVQRLGIALPLSAGLGANYLWQKSDLEIEGLSVGFNNGPLIDLGEVIRFNSAVSEASAVNVRPDLWVLPFLNVYGLVAVGEASTSIDAGLWLPDTLNNWQEVTSFATKAEFEVQTFGFGLTPTFGIGGGWVALDMNFAWSDVDALDQPAFSFVFGPRFGKTFKLKNPRRTLTGWVGGFRLNLASATSGSLNLSELIPVEDLQAAVDQGIERVGDAKTDVEAWWNALPPSEQLDPANRARYEAANRALERAGTMLTNLDGALSNLESGTVQYSLAKSQAQKWNFIVGGQFQWNEHLMFRAEYGFLGSRKQFLGGIQFRFGL